LRFQSKFGGTKPFLFNCQVCFKFGEYLLADIGEQETADFSFNSTFGTCVLSLTGKAILGPGNPSRLINNNF